MLFWSAYSSTFVSSNGMSYLRPLAIYSTISSAEITSMVVIVLQENINTKAMTEATQPIARNESIQNDSALEAIL